MTENSTTVIPLFLTEEKKYEIKEEIRDIEQNQMPEIQRRLALAYEDGDIPENNPFITAHEDLQKAMKRRNDLRELLMRAKAFKSRERADVIHLGSHVKIKYKDGRTREFQLVSGEESDIKANKISIDSPYGVAVSGKQVGDMVQISTPSGEVEVEIVG